MTIVSKLYCTPADISNKPLIGSLRIRHSRRSKSLYAQKSIFYILRVQEIVHMYMYSYSSVASSFYKIYANLIRVCQWS